MVVDLRKEKMTSRSSASRRRMRSNKDNTSCGGGRCNRTTTRTNPTSSKIKKKTRKPRKKSRSKTRKPKYLSLRLKFSTDHKKSQDQSTAMPTSTSTTTTTTDELPQLNLFPLHPENLVEDKDAHDENMAYLLSSADGGDTTLTGLLGAATTSSSVLEDEDTNNYSATALSPSASLTYAYGRQDSEEVALVRTAMRNKGRETSEERLVRYSEVVERRDEQEVSSCCVVADPGSWRNQRLSLKLDYEEILNAWSGKGSLYIHAALDCPQRVPDIHDDFLASEFSSGMSDGWGNSGGCIWRVPELMTTGSGNERGVRLIKVKEEEQQQEQQVQQTLLQQQEQVELNLKVGRREASVQRYKEKRLNRLFSKKIRYQVRKLNAEKRPRLKGRFVKKS